MRPALLLALAAVPRRPTTTAVGASIYDLVDEHLLPLNESTVLLGCTGRTNCTNHPHGRASDEDAIHRRFDYLTSFIQPMAAIVNLTAGSLGLEDHIVHLSWEVCRKPFDDCLWREVADGSYDAGLVEPAARAIRQLGRPIVLAVCNEMAAQGATGKYYGVGTPEDYLAMYDHIRAVFAQENVTNVVWSWNNFNADTVDHAQQFWDRYYPGDTKVDWVGINAFCGTKGNSSFYSLKDMYAIFYEWVAGRAVRPFFHAFGCFEDPDRPGWKKAWLDAIPALVGPAGAYPRIRALSFYSGDEYDIQSTPWTAAEAAVALNRPVFDALGYANATVLPTHVA